ncbi:hypothetical protein ACHAXA_001054 [Cyclostephanos tholiformis]|uniref:Transmembrane protein n=1 Tax=Cyclostephanos tholiformis TaxID=382380 RepID=A0ABD3RCC9_9STRA
MKITKRSPLAIPSLSIVGIVASSRSEFCVAFLHRRGMTYTTTCRRISSRYPTPHNTPPTPSNSSSESNSSSSSRGGRIAVLDDDIERRRSSSRRLTRPHPHDRHPPPPRDGAFVHGPTTTKMSLIPAPASELRSILPAPGGWGGGGGGGGGTLSPTGDQYVAYLGRTPRERYDSLFEGVSVAFVGSMFSYFVSFVVGQFLSTCMGVLFLFWPILRPEFLAYQRNWELIGGRDLVDVWMDDDCDGTTGGGALYGAYYVARIDDVCVVDDVRANVDDEYDLSEFEDYATSNDELEGLTGIPWKLRLRLVDDMSRRMQVHSRMSEGYLDIRPGMIAIGVLLSTGRDFRKLAGMTDFCVVDVVTARDGGDGSDVTAIAWVGDYPYLNKAMFLRTLDENGITDRLLDDYDEMCGHENDDNGDDIGDDEENSDGEQDDDMETEEYINVR